MHQAVAISRSGYRARIHALVPFALAGVAVAGGVLDAIDAPHDNMRGVFWHCPWRKR